MRRRLDRRVRIWLKRHEGMDPSCLASRVQAACCVIVWGIFSCHTLGPLGPIEHCLHATVYLSIAYLFTFHKILCHATKVKLSQTDLLNITMSWPSELLDLTPIEHPWGVVQQEIHIVGLQQLCVLCFMSM